MNEETTSKEEIEVVLEAIKNDKVVRVNTARKSHFWFFHYYFRHYLKYELGFFQKEMLSLVQQLTPKLKVFTGFRGCSKSTILTTSFPLFAIMGELNIKHVLILSQTQPKAQMHFQNIKRELETNAALKEDLGPFREEKTRWGADSLIISNFNAMISIGSIESSIRGIRFNENRPQLILLDDVEDLASIKSKEATDKVWNWFTSEVIPCGDKDTTYVVVGNMLSNNSLVGRLKKGILENTTDGLYREYPIIKNGQPLWPGKYRTLEEVEEERRKVTNEISWQREFMLKIVSEEDQVIKPEWLKYYDTFPQDDPALPYRYSLVGVDMAMSQKATADFTAMIGFSVYGSKENLRVYVHANPVNERLTFQAMKTKAEMLSQSLGRGSLAKILVEDVGIQSVLPQELVADNFPAEGCKIQGDKRERLSIAAFLVEQGKVFFPNQGAEKLIEQLLGFGDADHDDLCDAFSMVLVEIIKKESGHPFTFFTAEKYFTTGKQEIKPDVKIAKPEEKPQPGITTTIIDTRPPWEKGGKTLEELGHEEDLKILEDERKKAEGPGDDGERKIKPSWF